MLRETDVEIYALLQKISEFPAVIGSACLTLAGGVVCTTLPDDYHNDNLFRWSLDLLMAAELVAKSSSLIDKVQHLTIVTSTGSYIIVMRGVYVIVTLTTFTDRGLAVIEFANEISSLRIPADGRNDLSFQP
ncbi:hypothetical protein BH10CYA1_BH10CYA1_24890 [soil metagenome]